MRRLVLLIAIATLAVACAAPAPSATPQHGSPPPTPASTPAPTTSPTPAQTPDATASLAPTVTPFEVITPEESVPPLEVDFDTAPTFPSPVLVVDETWTSAIGESGCSTIVYEPANDEFGRVTSRQEPCGTFPVLVPSKATPVNAGYPLVFMAPDGWTLGAQVVFSTDPYGPFWIIEATRMARPDGSTPPSSQVEIGRGDGFMNGEIDALAPTEPGDYLVTVQAQVGQTPAKWRTYDRTYYYWIRVP